MRTDSRSRTSPVSVAALIESVPQFLGKVLPLRRSESLTVEVRPQQTGLTLRPQVLHVRVEVSAGDDLDVEQHVGVVGAAELGALALEGSLLGGNDLELVDPAGDDVDFCRTAAPKGG